MFNFFNPQYLIYLWLLPVVIIIFILQWYIQKKQLTKFASPKMLSFVMPEKSSARSIFKFLLYIISLACIILAIADPIWGNKPQEVRKSGVDIMIAMDVSNSMLAEDIFPSRLTATKRAILQLIDKLEGDRIGLVVFGANAYTQFPITTDYSAAKLAVDNVSTNTVPKQGTNIGEAIELCINSFSKTSKNKKAIIVITDGENHEEAGEAFAAQAKDNGIVVHTIGVASVEGGPIPLGNNTFKTDKNGQTVITKLNEEALTAIAQKGSGLFVRASNSQIGLSQLYNEINSMQKSNYTSMEYTDYAHQFAYLLWPALILLFVEILLRNKRSDFWRNLLKY